MNLPLQHQVASPRRGQPCPQPQRSRQGVEQLQQHLGEDWEIENFASLQSKYLIQILTYNRTEFECKIDNYLFLQYIFIKGYFFDEEH